MGLQVLRPAAISSPVIQECRHPHRSKPRLPEVTRWTPTHMDCLEVDSSSLPELLVMHLSAVLFREGDGQGLGWSLSQPWPPCLWGSRKGLEGRRRELNGEGGKGDVAPSSPSQSAGLFGPLAGPLLPAPDTASCGHRCQPVGECELLRTWQPCSGLQPRAAPWRAKGV